MILLIIASTLIIYSFYKWATINNDYFKNQGIKYIKPTFMLGNTAALFFKTQTIYDFIKSLYNAFPDEKVIGFFNFRTPSYLIRDPEAIKQIAIKDFDYFVDRKFLFDATHDTVLGNTLFLMKGQQWRDMRSTLSPAFTGSKMRQMHELVTECAEQMSNYYVKEKLHLSENSSVGEDKRLIVEMKDVFSKYTTDVIASCAFGLQVNSFENSDNDFLRIGKILINFKSIKSYVKLFFLRITPWLTSLLGITFVNKEIGTFFSSMVIDTMEYREKHGIIRPDMINILLQVKKGTLLQNNNIESNANEGFATTEESMVGKTIVKRNWTDAELIGQCFVFFLAGFDSSSSVLSTIVYELARHSVEQHKLCDEIDAIQLQLNGQRISYDEIQKMKYLDMIVSESLRIWTGGMLDRECLKDYRYEDNNFNFIIPKGYQIFIPVTGIHMDPKYYPNPNKFDPERFNDANKSNINSSIYMPFGTGPRNCIGSRFALMQLKTILYYLLTHFTFEVCEKTQIPLIMDSSPLGLYPSKGLFIELKPRNMKNML